MSNILRAAAKAKVVKRRSLGQGSISLPEEVLFYFIHINFIGSLQVRQIQWNFFIKTNHCYDHITQKAVQCILYRDLPIDTLDCTVQMCGFPALDVAPMDQAIPKEMWVRWDGLQTHNPTTQVQPVQSLSTANVNYDSNSTIAYDLEEVMNMGYESNSNHSNNIASSIDEVIRAITPVT